MAWKDETKQLLTIDHDGLGAAKYDVGGTQNGSNRGAKPISYYNTIYQEYKHMMAIDIFRPG